MNQVEQVQPAVTRVAAPEQHDPGPDLAQSDSPVAGPPHAVALAREPEAVGDVAGGLEGAADGFQRPVERPVEMGVVGIGDAGDQNVE